MWGVVVTVGSDPDPDRRRRSLLPAPAPAPCSLVLVRANLETHTSLTIKQPTSPSAQYNQRGQRHLLWHLSLQFVGAVCYMLYAYLHLLGKSYEHLTKIQAAISIGTAHREMYRARLGVCISLLGLAGNSYANLRWWLRGVEHRVC